VKHGVTHAQYLPGGVRLEFRRGKHGGWASRYVSSGDDPNVTLYNFVYHGPELPKDAVKVRL
jgi:hypothetical protein